MADKKPKLLERWHEYIEFHDPKYRCLKTHKKSIGDTRQSSKRTVLWSSVSLFYIYGDITIGTNGNQQDTGSEAVVWGIPFIGITEMTFVSFVFIITLYFFAKMIFSIIRIHIICDSWMVFKEMLSLSDRDVHQNEAMLQEYGRRSENDDKDRHNLETWLFMMKYRLMGFLEYFFAPIIFSTVLAFWALFMLVMEIVF